MAPVRPVLPRHQLHQVLFDFFRVGLAGESQPMGKPRYMRVDHDSFLLCECVAQNNVRCFPADARQPAQFFHCIRNAARMFSYDCGSSRPNALGLTPKKAGGTNQSFESSR